MYRRGMLGAALAVAALLCLTAVPAAEPGVYSLPGERAVCRRYCAEPVAAAPDRIKIFVTNDVHGYVYEDPQRGRIGYARLRGAIDRAMAEGYTVILMDAGDAFSGNAMTQFDAGRSVAELMGAMDYRVLVPGNHAFDYNASEGDPLYYTNTLVPAVRRSAPDVAVTALNLTYRGGPVPGIDPGPITVLEDANFRLVVVGVLTPYTDMRTDREAVRGYDFGLIRRDGQPDHAATRQALLDQLAAAVAPYDRPGDVVLVLAHVGHDDASPDYAAGQVRGSDFARVPNVDAVVDAHSHNLVPVRRIGPVPYGLAGRYLENFVEITIEREGAAVELGMEIRDDAAATAEPSRPMLERLRAVADRLALGDPLFQLPDAFGDDGVNAASLPLGRFLCRAFREMTGADVALFNSGAIRSSLGPGWVTVAGVYDCLPHQNNLVSVSMTGRALVDLFAAKLARGVNAFPQFEGMTVHAWDQGPTKPLGVAGVLDAAGAPLSPERTYTVTVNSFMADGGDGYDFPPETRLREWGDSVSALVDLFRRTGLPAWTADAARDNLIIHPDRATAEAAAGK